MKKHHDNVVNADMAWNHPNGRDEGQDRNRAALSGRQTRWPQQPPPAFPSSRYQTRPGSKRIKEGIRRAPKKAKSAGLGLLRNSIDNLVFAFFDLFRRLFFGVVEAFFE